MTGTLIQTLRAQRNGLVGRHQGIHAAARTLAAMTMVPTAELAQRAEIQWYDRESEVDEQREALEALVEAGKPLPLFSDEILWMVMVDGTRASNMRHHVEEIAKLTTTVPAIVPVQGLLPSPEGWLDEEVETVIERYKGQINDLNTRLRDVNTHVKRMLAEHAPIPSYLRGRVMGLFGQADFDLGGETYTEVDFAVGFKAQREERGEHGVRFVHLTPKVMSRKFWIPLVGVEQAAEIGRAIEIIKWESTPRPGEPETLSGFGSHVSNKLDLFATR